MKNCYRLYHMLPLLVVALLFSACRESPEVGEEDGRLVLGRTEAREVVERGVDPGNRTLVFEGFNGTIMLEGETLETARLHFEKTARGADRQEAERRLGRISIDESGSGDAYRYIMRSDEPSMSAVHVSGQVPRQTSMRISLQSGEVALNGVEGRLSVATNNGNVGLYAVTGDADVEVRNGNLEIDVRQLPQDGTLRFRTSNGNIVLAVPPGASASVQARTSAGDVRIEGLAFTSRELDRSGAGATFRGRLGQATATIEVQTDNGTITLTDQRIVPTDLAQPGAPAVDTTGPDEPLPPDTVRTDTLPADTVRAAPADTLAEIEG